MQLDELAWDLAGLKESSGSDLFRAAAARSSRRSVSVTMMPQPAEIGRGSKSRCGLFPQADVIFASPAAIVEA